MRRIFLITAMVFASSAQLAVADALIDGAKQCTQYFPTEEQNRAIPVHLLAAISTTETGRYHEGLGMAVPWPWTINVEGKGYYYSSKAEAISATQKFLAQGKRSIDVGCMQVNLKHHPKAFRNLNEAFDPATNVGYAARFLSENFAEMGNWIKAAASYHSRTTSRGNAYLGRVEKNWTSIVNKVRAARGEQQVASAAPAMKAQAAMPSVITHRAGNRINSTHGVRMIEVSQEPTVARAQRSDVLVIRTAQAEQTRYQGPAEATITRSVSQSSIDRPAAQSNVSARQPNFVFAN
ncbi:MAG: lytic transglycosylase domain-containing protein [Alphaproteobacteria bacterium]|nr:lytic transglycosylase domain-containing protein [Alphaproteobacteria bacterium]